MVTIAVLIAWSSFPGLGLERTGGVGSPSASDGPLRSRSAAELEPPQFSLSALPLSWKWLWGPRTGGLWAGRKGVYGGRAPRGWGGQGQEPGGQRGGQGARDTQGWRGRAGKEPALAPGLGNGTAGGAGAGPPGAPLSWLRSQTCWVFSRSLGQSPESGLASSLPAPAGWAPGWGAGRGPGVRPQPLAT